MKKILLSIGLLIGSLFAFDKVIPQKNILDILKLSPIYIQLAPQIKNHSMTLKGTEKNGFYIIEIKTKKGKRGVIYITSNGKYTILGEVIDNEKNKLLLPHFPVNKKIVQNGILFTFGKGKKDLYLVTDPQCPFCRMMEAKTKKTLEENYKVHVILFPLPFHKYAKAMSYYILAGKTDAEKAKRLQDILGGSNEWKNFHPTKAQKAEFDKMLENSKKAVEELGARGTPTVYDKNFNPINWETLVPKGKK
jgi:thiol:disulfide interchange protein DsbC